MKLPQLSQGKQSVLNIVGCMIVVVINTLINFFLSPFIVEHLGVEANGYITLANNFISYISLIKIALDSMCGRFVLIEIRKGNIREANEYYTSVLFGDWFLAAVLIVPVTIFVAFIDKFIQVDGIGLTDVRLLFAFVFAGFFIPLCLPKWANATYVTNNLYLRSIKSALSAIVRAISIYFLFLLCEPAAYFVAVAGLIMKAVEFVCEFFFKRKLLPGVRVKREYFNFKKLKTLLTSGIWNTVSKCGDLLLEGLDILIANLYIDPMAAGILSLSKIVPNMINQITGTITTTFGPKITYQYADSNIKNIVKEVKNDIKLTSLIAGIPIGITIVFGVDFFSLWVPSQDSGQLALLATIALIGVLATGISKCVTNIFTMANKLKLNSIVMILSGLINVGVVFILLNTTNLGIYAIALMSSIVAIVRTFAFIAPYGAICIGEHPLTFFGALIKGMLNVLISVIVGLVVLSVSSLFAVTWLRFFLSVCVAALITLIIDFCLVLNRSERDKFKQAFSKLLKKKK